MYWIKQKVGDIENSVSADTPEDALMRAEAFASHGPIVITYNDEVITMAELRRRAGSIDA